MLSREAVKEKLISWGIESPTDEQINDYLAQISKEIKSSEEKAARYKEDSLRVKELTKELDDLKGQNMTEVEKLQKELEDTTKRLSMSEKAVKDMQMKASLAEIGIVGEDSEGLFGEDGSLNTAKLGEILSAREKNAVATYQKQALDSTPSPSGGKDDEPDKPYKEIVESVVASHKAKSGAADIVNAYT